MAMRRPRVKVAANLSIRRPTKAVVPKAEPKVKEEELLAKEPQPPEEDKVEEQQQQEHEQQENGTSEIEERNEQVEHDEQEETPTARMDLNPSVPEDSTPSPAAEKSAFKFPKPVEELPKLVIPAPTSQSTLDASTEEQLSPKKLDSRFAYINALNSPRKRIRTESMTSNKSYSDVSLKSRKTIKQEESQKASDAKRDLRKRLNNIQNVDKQSLTMFDMIYYNPAKNPMKTPAPKSSTENVIDKDSRGTSKSRSVTPARTMAPPPPPPPVQDVPKSELQLTPQIKLGPNGEMILDEASLVIENEREKEMRDTLAKAEIVYMDEFSGNSGYYSRYKRTRDWKPEETIRFYRCLHTIGTDFSMMIQLFPNRTRRDLKLKFKKEERLNLQLVNKALLYPKEFNIEELQQQFQEEDEELERQRELERQQKAEMEEKLRQQKLAKKLQLLESKSRNPKKKVSKSARVLLDMDKISAAEALKKDKKPRRRKRKVPEAEAEVVQKDSEGVKEPKEDAPKPKPKRAKKRSKGEQNSGDNIQEVPVATPTLASSATSMESLRVNSDPYIPNGGFESSEVNTASEFTQPVAHYPEEQSSEQVTGITQLDIDSMDIDIVDEQSRSLYEIKAEPKVFPVRIYEHVTPIPSDAPNVVTLENLDDHSQTMVMYEEPQQPRLSREMNICEQNAAAIDPIEAKYYGGNDIIYQPMPTNAPVAHPVKTETICHSSQYSSRPTICSPPLEFHLHDVAAPAGSFSAAVIEPIPEEVPETASAVTVRSEASEANRTLEEQVELIPEHEMEPNECTVDSIRSTPSVVESIKEDPISESESRFSEETEQTTATTTTTDGGEGGKVEQEEDETTTGEGEDEPRGLGPLEDIDINSLVLVESQDATRPGRTIYEIYVIDPATDKLSEKPLDVPQDVIENIRSILEVGEEG